MSCVDNSCGCAQKLERIEQNQHEMHRELHDMHRELHTMMESVLAALQGRFAPGSDVARAPTVPDSAAPQHHDSTSTPATVRLAVSQPATSSGSSATFLTEGGTRVE